jgi:hypothetical protein
MISHVLLENLPKKQWKLLKKRMKKLNKKKDAVDLLGYCNGN